MKVELASNLCKFVVQKLSRSANVGCAWLGGGSQRAVALPFRFVQETFLQKRSKN
jgi:hypothetical protein